MKLLRYGPFGHEKSNISPETLGSAELARLAAIPFRTLPPVAGQPRLGVPVKGIGKFIAIGLNYRDHAIEANMPIPAQPIVFTKAISCLSGPHDDVMLPKDALRGDWEVELGVCIDRTARHVAGYAVVNDVSERAWQLERGSPWDQGKGFDTFGPVGPYLVTADEAVTS